MASYDRDVNYSCSSFIILFSGSVGYPMPYASCSVVSWCLMWNVAQLSSGILLIGALLVPRPLGLCSPFLFRVFDIALWDSLSGLHAFSDSLSGFPGLWLGSCIVGRLVWPFIGYPLLGVHPSMSVVRWLVVGYCCNCLDGQLKYWATTHQLISMVTNVWLMDVP